MITYDRGNHEGYLTLLALAQLAMGHWLWYSGRDKLAAISGRHFQMHFLEWKCINFE